MTDSVFRFFFAVKLNAVSTIDFDETKKYIEIVDWRKVDSKEFDRMIRKVSAEGGQFLIKAVDR